MTSCARADARRRDGSSLGYAGSLMTCGNPSHEEVIAALGFVSERSLGLQVLPLSVRDGHHGVSVASALGYADIDAYVTEVVTRADAVGAIKLTDLPLKSHE